jgi:hypothetical protein
MARKRRENSVFSLSFLDCICCGFGAIILLFVISMGANNPIIRGMKMSLEKVIAERLAMLSEYRSTKELLATQLISDQERLDFLAAQIDEMKSMLAELEQQFQQYQAGKDGLLVDLEAIMAEIAAMQKDADLPQETNLPIGVPVENNYLAFVLDTSGSMRDPNSGYMWPIVVSKIEDVLEAYPIVDGIQIFDADGRNIIGGRNQWLPDSPEIRERIKWGVRRYGVFSNSNPVPGIIKAIRTLHRPDDPDMDMGVYVFGDEFTGTADGVLRRIDQLNPEDEEGNRKVTINAIGFPNVIRYSFSMGQTGLKFANLMRELTYQHGGAFIAVND